MLLQTTDYLTNVPDYQTEKPKSMILFQERDGAKFRRAEAMSSEAERYCQTGLLYLLPRDQVHCGNASGLNVHSKSICLLYFSLFLMYTLTMAHKLVKAELLAVD